MQIWVDADACPKAIKEILYRAATRSGVPVLLVANVPLRTPPSPLIRTVLVAAGMDEADREIARRAVAGDLVITADIPLAAAVIANGAHALDPRGEFYCQDNIHERLSVRNLLDELRGAGIETGGPAPFHPSDRQAFANQLDRFLARSRPAANQGGKTP